MSEAITKIKNTDHDNGGYVSLGLKLLLNIRQFQPSNRLVKIVLAWWVMVCIVNVLPYFFKMTSFYENLKGFSDILLVLLLLALIVFSIVCLVELILLTIISNQNLYQIQRQYPNNVPIFHQTKICVLLTFKQTQLPNTIRNLLNHLAKNRIFVKFSDEYPDQLSLVTETEMPIHLTFELNSTTQENSTYQIIYTLRANQRGTGYFNQAWLFIFSPFKLFRRKVTINEQTVQKQATNGAGHYLRVLADFSHIITNQLPNMFKTQTNIGVHNILQQGNSSEFLKLREYTAGDSIRQIDWKASSRQRRLMSKSYEQTNEQQIVFLLDCSEQMYHQDTTDFDGVVQQNNLAETLDGKWQISHFDKVLNAVLLLSYIANQQGDKVGLMTFGGIELYLAPKKGASLIRHLLNETADIQPTMQTSDYLQAGIELNKKLKKRSIIILITNTRQEASNELVQAVQLLSYRHKVIFANLTENTIYQYTQQKYLPTELDDALLYQTLLQNNTIRKQLHKKLNQSTGTFCLNSISEHLSIKLTQAYFSVRR